MASSGKDIPRPHFLTGLSTEQRRDYFNVLLTCLNSPREHVLNVFSPTAISVEEANDVIEQFYPSGDSNPAAAR
jgi:hypothetical protein